jgi:4-hydroxy-4-methyl-2-oxoglutarate aldolase
MFRVKPEDLDDIAVAPPGGGDSPRQILYTAVVADILDAKGYMDQALDPSIRPLASATTLFGRALTVQARHVSEMPEQPFLNELRAVDALSPGDIFVGAVDGEEPCGFWGELLSTAAVGKGARGAVIDFYARDTAAVATMGFPVFARGCCPLDSLGRTDVVHFGEPIDCAGVHVTTGDYVIGDGDGVVVIPAQLAEEVVSEALDKVSREGEMRRALQSGMGPIEAYERYGVL